MSGRLGAVLAGGRSSRFGSDKAEARLGENRLLDIAVAQLRRWCDAVVVVGRDDPAHECVADWPSPGLGPLGGIGGALRFAKLWGAIDVLTSGVDAPNLPADLLARLEPASAFLDVQPVIGLWSASDVEAFERLAADGGSRAVRRFAEAIGARAVWLPAPLTNINRPEDLARL